MIDKLKNVGLCALGLVGFCAMLIIPIALIYGSVALGAILISWLYAISYIVFAINLLILLPMGIFKRIRPYAGVGLLISSFAYGATLWFLGLLLTYHLWGIIGLIIGLMIFGIGVVPMAMLATLFNGLWSHLISLVILVLLTFGSRILALFWTASAPSADNVSIE
jgi:hypothetical protein